MLGSQIAAARRELGWTAAELAERVGVSAPVISRLEKGHPTTQIGTVLEAAVLCGVPLFGRDPSNPAALRDLAQAERDRAALLPTRVRQHTVQIDDDF
ncbi:helix-turn-helix transcriptional regulator [Modestobacter sp. VKM Ac-2979]|uniref:helix-turn-helix transcriptional regulator n=1 Tax=unclassified Modestobacter TaxID=2643866 RepID=UPI0022ABA6C4|nr:MULTISPECIES: helix-turn-helix transcriptional regulator [unclassified Modestobacter]MCZ2813722.1 helix-turn-helix transcriptional regulator [Modestobacter sp. VKM Ac-2979]MCZ2844303.1 helix-turn-helix transcriptional regulator [Modestobacter sp. VKM Ac-2980]